MKRILTIAMLAGLLLASQASAGLLFSESFEYGDTRFDIDEDPATGWDTGSGVVDYDPVGMTSDQLENEAGGSMHHDYGSGNRGGNKEVSVDPFPGSVAGSEWWFAGLLQIANNEESTAINFTNTQSVNSIGFGSDGSGNIILKASNTGSAAADQDTGLDVTLGETYLFIVRGTKGTGISPEDSFVDIWVNPADTSSVAALGSPDFGTTGAKFGRESGSYNSVTVSLSHQSRVDEIRMGESLNDVVVPEPATMSLLALGGLAGVLRRRR
ncbi:MAG: PEP-CTERM sorting domain-containing protein [Phycisphaerae bacterium]